MSNAGSSFAWTDEQRVLAESALKYVERGYTARIREESLVHEHGCPPARWSEFAELGWLGLPLAEAAGGLGGTTVDVTLVAEALGRALVVEPYIANAILAAPLLQGLAGGAVREEWCEAVVAGTRRVALAAYERGARFDVFDVGTRAERSGSGYRLEGAKELVLGGPGADALAVLARTAGMRRERRGLTLFLVPTASPGVAMRHTRTYAGAPTAQAKFDGVVLAADHVIGVPDQAWPLVEQAIDRATVALAAESVGAMTVVLTTTVEYLKTRRQFGRVLAGNQALQHRLVDLYVAIEETRALARAAAVVVDGADARERNRLASAVKVRSGQAARLVAEESVQLHGAIGMTEEYVLGRYVRYLGAVQTLFGDVPWHLERLAALHDGPT